MKKRNRNEETGVSLEYITQIHNQHQSWMKGQVETKNITTLNAEADFTDEAVFKEVFEFVIE
jgi:deoxyadenosine/deoxycytidine kinase